MNQAYLTYIDEDRTWEWIDKEGWTHVFREHEDTMESIFMMLGVPMDGTALAVVTAIPRGMLLTLTWA